MAASRPQFNCVTTPNAQRSGLPSPSLPYFPANISSRPLSNITIIMQSLLVLFALFAGAAVAHDDSLKTFDTSPTTSGNQYPLTTSEYLKMVLGRASGMVNLMEIRMDAGISVTVDPYVLEMLPVMGLWEAYRIAEMIDLKQILEQSTATAVTMFVPTDEAIRKWMEKVPVEVAKDINVLTKLVKAWIVPDMAVRSTAVFDEMMLPTMATDVKLRMNIYDAVHKMTVNGAAIVRRDFEFGRNIVHVIDGMMFPLPDGSIVDTLAKVGYFSTLIDLVKKAGLQDYLAYTDALTVFAPVNKAFDLVPADVMAELAANKTKLQYLLKYHVVPDTYYSAGIVDGQLIDSAIGYKIKCDIVDGKFMLNKLLDQPAQAEIMYPDMPTTNGVVHVVDKVLTPPKSKLVFV